MTENKRFVDDGFEVYPKALLEGIVDILKIIGDVELNEPDGTKFIHIQMKEVEE